MICVECRRPVVTLYTEYSKGNIRLTQCEHCKSFADKYVELDNVVVFIDLLLHKPQAYRHILFNRLSYQEFGLHPGVGKLGALLILFDVYIKWFRIEREITQAEPVFFTLAPLTQYGYILMYCVVEHAAFHAGVQLAMRWRFHGRYAIIKYNYLSMALIISSFTKLISLLMAIWNYVHLEYSWLLNCLVLTSNAEATTVFLDGDWKEAMVLLFVGVVFRVVAQVTFISATGYILPWIIMSV